jgi:hypothetical protein
MSHKHEIVACCKCGRTIGVSASKPKKPQMCENCKAGKKPTNPQEEGYWNVALKAPPTV